MLIRPLGICCVGDPQLSQQLRTEGLFYSCCTLNEVGGQSLRRLGRFAILVATIILEESFVLGIYLVEGLPSLPGCLERP